MLLNKVLDIFNSGISYHFSGHRTQFLKNSELKNYYSTYNYPIGLELNKKLLL
jgi:hypothetical protein